MYNNIVIPTDGSSAAELATRYAVDLAKKYGATLYVLYVVDTDAVDIAFGTEQVQRIKEGRFSEMKELEHIASSSTKRVARAASEQGVEVVESVKAGVPRKQIVQHADENEADLIVMSSHGRSGVSRFLLGSVTERVLRLTNIPVLVVPVKG